MSETSKIKNLWGDLPVENNIRTPYVILKEQASILTEATNGLLVGTVSRESDNNAYNPNFNCTLEIKVPSINNYLISIVRVIYPMITIYPLEIFDDIQREKHENCDTEEELVIRLERILSSKKVKRIILGLLSEARSDTEK